MRILHIDYGTLEFNELRSLTAEIKLLINSCDNFTHFELENFTQNDRFGMSIKMELMENNRPQANNQPPQPAKSIVSFSVFRNTTDHTDGLRQILFTVMGLIQDVPFHDEVIPVYNDE